MKIKLELDEESLKKDFFNLRTKYDVAKILEVDYKTLVYLLYRIDPSKRYKTFSIKKKSGGERIICAPITTLKIIQRKLSQVLYLVYFPRSCVFGFCKNKGIKDNASVHIKEKFVFNVDLENFFPSIHIGRVIGLFMARPFNFSKEVAILLAQISCYDGKLPQGAPTSPVISNLICFGMDRQLKSLAKKYHCNYSRYADDLSFSSKSKTFSKAIGVFDKESGKIECGNELQEIIESNNFKVNKNKVRMQPHFRSQCVTSLVVNEKVNIKREYIRNIRAILHSWKKDGINKAEEKFFKLNPREINPYKNKPLLNTIIWGKIKYIQMIKGQKSPIYRRLMNSFNKIMKNNHPIYPLNAIAEIENALWIIESTINEEIMQGTGFILKNYGLITAYHVVEGEDINVYKYNDTTHKYKAQIIKKSPDRDIAVLEIIGLRNYTFNNLEIGKIGILNNNPLLTIAGFPEFHIGDGPTISDSKITGYSHRNGKDHFMLSSTLVSGMSGGPILDSDNKVVGIMMEGINDIKEIKYQVHFAGISIKYIDEAI